tara:strand:+ start:487 stop:678 length:192 start_codon:yes stop_codon:yes gene_type:complete
MFNCFELTGAEIPGLLQAGKIAVTNKKIEIFVMINLFIYSFFFGRQYTLFENLLIEHLNFVFN